MATQHYEASDPFFEPISDFAVIDAVEPRLVPQASTMKSDTGNKTWRYQPTKIEFDPSKHLAIEEPEWRKKLSDFGYDDKLDGISEIAASAPFRLFTDEAVRLLRNDLLSEPVQSQYVFSSERAPYAVRGYIHESRFIREALTHPDVLGAISKAAGIELIPWLDYDIGHTNIQLGAKGKDGVRDLADVPTMALPEGQPEASEYDNRPVDDWHYDCVPFVAVLMLSDTTGMVGGETAVMCKDGSIGVVPGPVMGKVVVMQGSRLKHSALRAKNCSERIAMVLSLRPKDPMVKDMSHLSTILGFSERNSLCHQWLVYRLKVLEDRFRIQREKLEASGPNSILEDDMKSFGLENIEFLQHSLSEVFSEFK